MCSQTDHWKEALSKVVEIRINNDARADLAKNTEENYAQKEIEMLVYVYLLQVNTSLTLDEIINGFLEQYKEEKTTTELCKMASRVQKALTELNRTQKLVLEYGGKMHARIGRGQ